MSGDLLTPGEVLDLLRCRVCGEWGAGRGCRCVQEKNDHLAVTARHSAGGAARASRARPAALTAQNGTGDITVVDAA